LFVVGYAPLFAWPLRNRYRWLLLAMSPLVVLACNVIRTMPLVWLDATAQTDPTARWRGIADAVHLYSGWFMLPVAFLALAGLIQFLKWCDLRVERYRLAA
jgi:exosortase/archaeosortase family protein